MTNEKENLKTLTGIAHRLKSSNKKIQLIYGFNGLGKICLSRHCGLDPQSFWRPAMI